MRRHRGRACSARSTLIASRRPLESTRPTGRGDRRAHRRRGRHRRAGRPGVAHLLSRRRPAVPGHDDVGEVGDRVEHVGPQRRVALERERRDPEGAEAAGEAHVDVGDEHDEVALGVPLGGEHLDAPVSCAAPVTMWVTGRVRAPRGRRARRRARARTPCTRRVHRAVEQRRSSAASRRSRSSGTPGAAALFDVRVREDRAACTGRSSASTAAANGSHCERTMSVSIDRDAVVVDHDARVRRAGSPPC